MQINLQGLQAWWKTNVLAYHEGPNNDNPFTVWQIGINHQPWCDASAQESAVVGGGFDGWADPRCHCQGGAKGDAYVPYTEQHAAALGLWHPKGSGYTPQPWDQETYDWNGDGVGDHISYFVAPKSDGTHVTAEGNHNDQGQYCIRDNTYVRGWIALSQVASGNHTPPPAPQPTPQPAPPHSPTFPLPMDNWYGLASRDTRNHSGYYSQDRPAIHQFTQKLHDRGWNLGVSDTFTPGVDQVVRKFQADKHLTIDGKVGPITWDKIWNSPVT